MQTASKKRAGFSLIEVTLAIFVVGLGLLTLFSLFPAGLSQATTAQDDTQVALFAEYFFSEMRGRFTTAVQQQGNWERPGGWQIFQPQRLVLTAAPQTFTWPTGSGRHVRYFVEIVEIPVDVWGVRLYVQAGEFGATDVQRFKEGALAFYTELVRVLPPGN